MLHVNPLLAPLVPAVLYIGPDQFLPLTSALGALSGILLLFWQRILAAGRQARDFFGRIVASRRTRQGP